MSLKPDNVIVDKMGWASFTRRNMQILDIDYGDRFHLGVDLDECHDSVRSLFFIKINEHDSFNRLSETVTFSKRKQRGGFRINPVLRLLKIKPPFVCDISIGGDDFDFSFQLPDHKLFVLDQDIYPMLRPLTDVLVDNNVCI